MDTIKPDHYKHKDKDLIQEWYERYSLDEFRAIMKSHIEKYIRRYERKNGVEDLEKAGEYIRRLKIIENNVWVISEEEEEVPKPGEIVDGWLVEEEQKYNVKFKVKSSFGTVGIFLYKEGDEVLAGDNFRAYYPKEDEYRLTEQEIRNFQNGDILFEHFAVKVEELEE